MWSTPSLRAIAPLALLLSPAAAQTWSSCNPLTSGSCPPNPALGREVSIDLASESDSFTVTGGSVNYGASGAVFTVAKSGDSPTISSIWYIMFGRVEVVMKASPGAGLVSSVVLQSDTLDEIDWEWLGADPAQVQTNFFGKGNTDTYDRGAFHPNPGSQSEYHTYTIDWTPEQIVWQINGQTIRALNQADAAGQYPQTPMQIKMGSWSGGDPANSPGTIEWARGPTDYSQGPFSMYVRSIKVTDYSKGTQYRYKDTSGTWKSIEAVGGSVNAVGGGSPVESAAPAVTSKSTGQPLPFEGTHRQSESITTRTGYPWVAEPSNPSSTFVTSSYPGLPSGWTVSGSGKVIPASSAPVITPSIHHLSLAFLLASTGCWLRLRFDI
ncbi:cell wall glucanase [Eremomyces bilateralis CBS 781.70]|uniref:chitinase n=1 Tax=Eremomyces bilateralis CBS 781.70 TaxID=1392243 RepID=A0A6G1FYJ3_9PEZI|nr:cell wall glucanase [Eremomyces bilateralis CBS 781.70]KAF1810838.1 cell wall glucanase [Eremomyces bilateralis CBS 781.70]